MTARSQTFPPCPAPFTDHVYKTVAGVDVPLRVWPALADAEGPRPWLLWFHGGGFTAGKHVVPNTWVVPAFRARGYHVVSAAYRFIPHANMRDIVADCSDSLAWCRANLPKLLGSSKLDLDAYVVGGDSAGGTLATLAGHRFTPRPRVVLDVFGVTDPADTGLTIPPPDGTYMAERARWFPLSGKFSEDDVQAALRDRERAHAVTICPWTWEMPPNMDQATLRSFWGTPDFVLDDSHYLRMDMMCVVNRDRQLFRVLARGETPQDDPKTDAELRSALAEFSALKLLDGAKGYPPTFFMHGEKDQTVPVAQSKAMADKLRGMGVVVGEAYSPDGDHCFDNVIEKPGDAGWDAYVVPCLDFIDAHVWHA